MSRVGIVGIGHTVFGRRSDATVQELAFEAYRAALEDGDPDVFLSAVGHVAKARGMSAIAESTGLGRESLYKAFAPGAKPRYDTVLRVLQSFGVKLNVTA